MKITFEKEKQRKKVKGGKEGEMERREQEGKKEEREGRRNTLGWNLYLEKCFMRAMIVKQGFLSFIVHNYLFLQI